MEIGNLPEKEFRIMIVKMIQDLRKTMEKMQEYQRSSPTAVKVLSPTSGHSDWGSDKGTVNKQEQPHNNNNNKHITEN